MEENEQMKVEFESHVKEKDLMDFKIYHNYHSFSGIAGLIFGIIALVIFALTVTNDGVNISYKLMMLLFGFMFTVYTPISMKLKVKQQMKTVRALKEPVKYTVTEDKIVLEQGEITEDLLWDDVFKIKFTGKSMVMYLTAVRANIIPIKDMGVQTEKFVQIARKRLKPFQVKVNMDKVNRAVERNR